MNSIEILYFWHLKLEINYRRFKKKLLLLLLLLLAFKFFIISVSWFVILFPGFLKIITPGWGFSTIFQLQGPGFAISLCLVGGEFARSKKFPGGLPGGRDGQARN